MRARSRSFLQQRPRRALLPIAGLLLQLGCAEDETPTALAPRPEVPAPTLETSLARPLDAGSANAGLSEAGSLDARGPLLDAGFVDGADEGAQDGSADAQSAAAP